MCPRIRYDPTGRRGRHRSRARRGGPRRLRQRVTCQSVYRWEGEIHDDDEEILLAKTTDEGYPALRDRIVDLHPYDVPYVERFDEADVLPAFAEWRAAAAE